MINTLQSARVVTRDGRRGTLIQAVHANDGREQMLVALDDKQFLIPTELLVAQPDGTYQLLVDRADMAHYQVAERGIVENSDQRIVPIVEEVLHVATRQVAGDLVRIHKTVHERTETVDQPLLHETVQVERVTINRVLDAPVEVRHDGDTLIVPIIEEMLVVEKRLMLREELHITKRQTLVHDPQQVSLRREELTVERVPMETAQVADATQA